MLTNFLSSSVECTRQDFRLDTAAERQSPPGLKALYSRQFVSIRGLKVHWCAFVV
jgi:hypothetical protein